MRYAQKHILDGRKDLRQVVDELERVMEKGTLSALCESSSSISCNGDAEETGDLCLL